MKNICIIFILLNAGLLLHAQEKQLFSDDFSDNHNNWILSDKKTLKVSINKDYRYEIIKHTDQDFVSLVSVPLDPGKEFHITAKIRNLRALDKDPYAMTGDYGIFFGAKDDQNGYYIVVSEKSFWVYKYVNGVKTDLYHENKNYGEDGQINLASENNKWKIMVNELEVGSMDAQPLMGDKLGIRITDKVHCSLENITIFESDKKPEEKPVEVKRFFPLTAVELIDLQKCRDGGCFTKLMAAKSKDFDYDNTGRDVNYTYIAYNSKQEVDAKAFGGKSGKKFALCSVEFEQYDLRDVGFKVLCAVSTPEDHHMLLDQFRKIVFDQKKVEQINETTLAYHYESAGYPEITLNIYHIVNKDQATQDQFMVYGYEISTKSANSKPILIASGPLKEVDSQKEIFGIHIGAPPDYSRLEAEYDNAGSPPLDKMKIQRLRVFKNVNSKTQNAK